MEQLPVIFVENGPSVLVVAYAVGRFNGEQVVGIIVLGYSFRCIAIQQIGGGKLVAHLHSDIPARIDGKLNPSPQGEAQSIMYSRVVSRVFQGFVAVARL